MKKGFYKIFFAAFLCGNFATSADDSDRLRDLESVVVESNQVKKAEGRLLLREHLKSVEDLNQRQSTSDVEMVKLQQASDEQAARVRLLKSKLMQTRNRGGETAQDMQRASTRELIQREAEDGVGMAFKNALQYWTEEGFYNAGFAAGYAAGNEAFGESDRVWIPYAPHHGRRDRE